MFTSIYVARRIENIIYPRYIMIWSLCLRRAVHKSLRLVWAVEPLIIIIAVHAHVCITVQAAAEANSGRDVIAVTERKQMSTQIDLLSCNRDLLTPVSALIVTAYYQSPCASIKGS